jgi:HEAT repeat protein
VAYVARLTEHDEYRVRSEAAAALALIGGLDAEVQLVRLLDDPDDRVRLKTIVSLSDAGVALALRRLLRLLERPDRLNRHFVIKQEVIAVLARARVHEALPVLLRLSRRRFVLGRHSRTLRRLAQEAVATIRAGVPVREPSGLDVSAVGAT